MRILYLCVSSIIAAAVCLVSVRFVPGHPASVAHGDGEPSLRAERLPLETAFRLARSVDGGGSPATVCRVRIQPDHTPAVLGSQACRVHAISNATAVARTRGDGTTTAPAVTDPIVSSAAFGRSQISPSSPSSSGSKTGPLGRWACAKNQSSDSRCLRELQLACATGTGIYFSDRVLLETSQADSQLDVELRRGATVAGRVGVERDASARIRVFAFGRPAAGERASAIRWRAWTVTDNDGYFAFDSLPPGDEADIVACTDEGACECRRDLPITTPVTTVELVPVSLAHSAPIHSWLEREWSREPVTILNVGPPGLGSVMLGGAARGALQFVVYAAQDEEGWEQIFEGAGQGTAAAVGTMVAINIAIAAGLIASTPFTVPTIVVGGLGAGAAVIVWNAGNMLFKAIIDWEPPPEPYIIPPGPWYPPDDPWHRPWPFPTPQPVEGAIEGAGGAGGGAGGGGTGIGGGAGAATGMLAALIGTAIAVEDDDDSFPVHLRVYVSPFTP